MNQVSHDQLWSGFFSGLNDYAIIILDVEGRVTGWNAGAQALNGFSREEIEGRHFSCFHPADSRAARRPEHELAMAQAAGKFETEGWRLRKDQTPYWAHVVIRPIYNERQVLCGYGKVVRDRTVDKQVQDISRTDYLTGLANRRRFDEDLAAAIATAWRNRCPLSLAMLDLDRFKSYNDSFGHPKGDEFLRQAAAGWSRMLRPEDCIARYGGEEFVIILPDTALAGAIRCLERVRAATPSPLTCSIGVAQWDALESADALIDRADRALYQAKARGRNRLVSYPETQAPQHPPQHRIYQRS